MRGTTGRPARTIINESGIYSLILKSRKPEAKAFQRWVTSVVFPAIRKEGGYVMDQEKVATGDMSDAEFLAKAMKVADRTLALLTEERDALLSANRVQQEQLAEAKPKVAFVDDYVDAGGTQTMTDTSKVLGIKPHQLFP